MGRRGFFGLAVAAALLAVSGSVVEAAAPGGGGGGGQRRGFGRGRGAGGGLQLLGLPAVQQELKMTAEQIAKIDPKQQELRQSFGGGGGGGQQLSLEERQKRTDAQNKAVAEILDATQL